jgi:NAD(P)-dependent dehydrogenase (short-subunit alcohol dehydrogenase family)
MSSSMTAVIGAVEELAQSSRTISLVDEIFEINFFANVNIIKAILPVMRERKNGHIIVITGISKSPQLVEDCSTDQNSWTPRYARTGHVLLITMGHRRILRRAYHTMPDTKHPLIPYRAWLMRSRLSTSRCPSCKPTWKSTS